MAGKWYIMNARSLWDGKQASLKEIRQIWNDGTIIIVNKGKSKVAICGSRGAKGYGVAIGDKMDYIIDTGNGHRKPPYNAQQLEVLGLVDYTLDNIDKQGEFDENKKYGVFVFK